MALTMREAAAIRMRRGDKPSQMGSSSVKTTTKKSKVVAAANKLGKAMGQAAKTVYETPGKVKSKYQSSQETIKRTARENAEKERYYRPMVQAYEKERNKLDESYTDRLIRGYGSILGSYMPVIEKIKLRLGSTKIKTPIEPSNREPDFLSHPSYISAPSKKISNKAYAKQTLENAAPWTPAMRKMIDKANLHIADLDPKPDKEGNYITSYVKPPERYAGLSYTRTNNIYSEFKNNSQVLVHEMLHRYTNNVAKSTDSTRTYNRLAGFQDEWNKVKDRGGPAADILSGIDKHMAKSYDKSYLAGRYRGYTNLNNERFSWLGQLVTNPKAWALIPKELKLYYREVFDMPELYSKQYSLGPRREAAKQLRKSK